MTLRHFRIFTTVYEQRGMTAAAKKLYITQPSVSQAIRELETHYGNILFERFPKELLPTNAGKSLYIYATDILSRCDNLEDYMKAGQAWHTLKIGVNDTVASSLLPDFLRVYEQDHKIDDIKVKVNNSSLLRDRLRTNEIDFMLSDEFHPSSDLTSFLVGYETFIVVVSSAHPLASKGQVSKTDIYNCNLLLREEEADSRKYINEFFQDEKHILVPFWESISFDILIDACIQGIGVAFVPKQTATTAIAQKQLVALNVPGFHFTQNIYLAYQKNKYITPQMEQFFSICKNVTNVL